MKGSKKNSGRRASAKEHRGTGRIPFVQPMSYTLIGSLSRLPGVVDVKGEVLDISDGGVKIRIENRSLEVGTILRIRIPLYTKSNNEVQLPLLAEVKWVKDVSPNEHHAGVRFMV